jgi:FkbM family methyltransferase
MLKQLIKSKTPKFLLNALRKARLHPRLRAMGIQPRAAQHPVEYLGTPYGGHALDPSRIQKDSVVYTLGAGLDISFEEALIKKKRCHIHIYDPTPRSVAWLKENFKSDHAPHPCGSHLSIHALGIWSTDDTLKFYSPKNTQDVSYSLTNLQQTSEYIEVPCVSLRNAMEKNKHSHIDLLKLNVEGAEYAILNSAFDDGIRPKMILINYDEVHTQGDRRAPARLNQIASRIEGLGYKVAYAELARVTYVL